MPDKKTENHVSMLTVNNIPTINAIIAKGDRVELIPIKGGVKVVRIRRDEVKK